MWLNFLYTVQLLKSDVCTKFQNSRSSISGEFPYALPWSERLKKEKIEKEGKIKSQHPWFCLQ